MWIAGKPPDAMCCHIHTYTVQSSLRVTYAVCHHPCHTISQSPFGHITLVGYIAYSTTIAFAK